MAVIVVAGTKGGVGKTTVAACLCVEAMTKGNTVVVVDLDGQGSLSRWHELRSLGEKPVPGIQRLLKYPDEMIREARESGFDYVIVDTPPGNTHRIEEVIEVADLVVVPVRPSPLDVESMDAVVELCQKHDAPFVFVMNATKAKSKMTDGARKFLARHGEVLKGEIGDRVGYAKGFLKGAVGQEVEPRGPIPKEIAGLWAAIKKRISPDARQKRKV